MLRSVVQRFLCRRYAALLTPYSEGGLSAAVRARVAAHLDACPNCRAALSEMEAVAALLRANVPAAPAPPADLWSQLEARIQAEAPRPQPAPDAPVLPSPEPRIVWPVFGRAFASAGAVVGVAVACTLVILQKGMEVFPTGQPSPAAVATATPAAPDTVMISLVPKEAVGGRQSAVVAEAAPLTDGAAHQVTPRLPSSGSFAKTASPAPESLRRSVAASALPIAAPSRPIRLEIRPAAAMQVAALSRAKAERLADALEDTNLHYVEPSEPQDFAERNELSSVNGLAAADAPNTRYAFAVDSVRTHEAETLTATRVPLRQVAWADAELERRTVPASASAADDLMQERQRQTLFSYTR